MQNFTLKFGKYKGQQFLSTPTNYQNWLLSQDWFKMPSTQNDAMVSAQKQFSDANNKLRNWDGYSRRGAAIYDQMFEAEKAMDDAYYNDSDPSSPRWNGEYNYSY
jgi:hypothetical protein